MKSSNLKHFKLLLAVVLVGLTSAAQAQWAVYDARLEMGIKAVVDAIRGGAQSTVAAGSTTAEASAKAISQAMTNAEIDKQVDRFKQVGACDAMASSMSADARRTTPALGGRSGGVGGGTPPGQSDALNKALKVAEGKEPPPSPEVQAANGAAGACNTFARPGSPRAAACAKAGFSTSDQLKLADADIKAETILSGPQKTGEPFRRKLTISSNEEQSAIRSIRRNLMVPIELRELTKAELNSSAGRQYMSFKDSYEARMSMAESPIQNLTMNRFGNAANNTTIEVLLKGENSGRWVRDYLSLNAPEWKSRGVSADELMNIEVERRINNPNWHTAVAQMGGDPVQREQLMLSAHQSLLMWRQVQATEHGNLLLGQMLAALTRQEMTPQLNALHSSAAR